MLARLARDLPSGGLLHEPRWDGFRCLAFAAGGGSVDLRSPHHRPLARFPDRDPRSCPLDQLDLAPAGVTGAP
jgi:ATP-dependent DNA ligase